MRLSGPSVRLDPATHAVRGDLASYALADLVFAPHYARPIGYTVAAPTGLFDVANAELPARCALDPGMRFEVLDLSGDWAWGQVADGGAIGYVSVACLSHS